MPNGSADPRNGADALFEELEERLLLRKHIEEVILANFTLTGNSKDKLLRGGTQQTIMRLAGISRADRNMILINETMKSLGVKIYKAMIGRCYAGIKPNEGIEIAYDRNASIKNVLE